MLADTHRTRVISAKYKFFTPNPTPRKSNQRTLVYNVLSKHDFVSNNI